jgi:alpha-1,2-mannosyltransferase
MHQAAVSSRAVRHIAWAVAAAAALGLNGLPILGSLLPRDRGLKDFFQEWASARNWWQGRDLYTSQRQTVRAYLHRELQPGEVEVNAHPPPAVLLVLPLAHLEYPTALQIWNLLGICLVAASAYVTARELRLRVTVASLAPLAVLFCSNPVRAQFDQGQLNAVLLALLTAAWFCDRRGLSWASGAAVGAAAAIKLFPAYLLVYFSCRRNGRALLGMFAGALAMILMAWLLFGEAPYVEYFNDVLPRVESWRLAGLNASWHGFWLRLMAPPGSRFVAFLPAPAVGNVLALTGSAVVSAVAAYVTWRAGTMSEQSRAWAACVAGMLLCSPITWDHYFVLLLLPWIEAWLASRACWRQRLALGLASAGLWLNPVLLWTLWYGREEMARVTIQPFESLFLFSMGFFALLLLWGIVAWPAGGTGQGTCSEGLPAAQPFILAT